MKKKILVLGAGMYVTGRGTEGYGTILPILAEYQQSNQLSEIILVSNSQNGIKEAKNKVSALEDYMGTQLCIKYYSLNESPLQDIVNDNQLSGEMAIVSTPDNTHYEYLKQLMGLGINIQVVKPFVLKLEHALELTKVAKEKNLVCSVEFHKRYDEANQILKDQIQKNDIGEILYSIVEYSQRKIIPEKIFRNWCEQSSILQYLGVHYCDLIYFITGAIPTRVSCTGQKTYLTKQNINVHDSIQVNIEWKNDDHTFNSMILTNWVDSNKSSSMSDQKIKFIGTNGRLESDQKHRGMHVVTDNAIEDINPYFSRFYETQAGPRLRGYGPKSVQAFLNTCLNIAESEAMTSFKDAIFSTAITEASMKSLNSNGQWVNIENQKIQNYFPELYPKSFS